MFLQVRLKCHYNQALRAVAVDTHTSFRSLKQRLTEDYGFELTMKYEDGDGDLITLGSQNDLKELLCDAVGTVNCFVSHVEQMYDPHENTGARNQSLRDQSLRGISAAKVPTQLLSLSPPSMR